MYIKIKKTKINIFSIFLLAAFVALNFSIYIVILFFCVLVHELGHIIFIRHFKLNIISVDILPFGISIVTSNRLLPYKNDMLIAFGGPLFNLICGVLIIFYLRFIDYNKELMFALVFNLIYAAINLFPVKNLDGGRILESVLRTFMDEGRVFFIFNILSTVFLGILSFVAFLVLIATGYNFTLVLLCGYLFYTIHFAPKNHV